MVCKAIAGTGVHAVDVCFLVVIKLSGSVRRGCGSMLVLRHDWSFVHLR